MGDRGAGSEGLPRASPEMAHLERSTRRYRSVDRDGQLATDRWEFARRGAAQGRVRTLAGLATKPGYADGVPGKFRNPAGVAVDAHRNVYVADAGNHAIRRIENGTGRVTTIAGSPPPNAVAGDHNGVGADARLSSPRGVALTYDGTWGDPAALVLYAGRAEIFCYVLQEDDARRPTLRTSTAAVLAKAERRVGALRYVADTGNHRIRKITGAGIDAPHVSCFAGRCGNGTRSHRDSLQKAAPEPGFADGLGDWAAFDAPRGLAVHHGTGDVVIADTNNHAIRAANKTGFARTLAGDFELKETAGKGVPAPGCPPPCLRGVRGFRDGNATTARFERVGRAEIPSMTSAATPPWLGSIRGNKSRRRRGRATRIVREDEARRRRG